MFKILMQLCSGMRENEQDFSGLGEVKKVIVAFDKTLLKHMGQFLAYYPELRPSINDQDRLLYPKGDEKEEDDLSYVRSKALRGSLEQIHLIPSRSLSLCSVEDILEAKTLIQGIHALDFGACLNEEDRDSKQFKNWKIEYQKICVEHQSRLLQHIRLLLEWRSGPFCSVPKVIFTLILSYIDQDIASEVITQGVSSHQLSRSARESSERTPRRS